MLSLHSQIESLFFARMFPSSNLIVDDKRRRAGSTGISLRTALIIEVRTILP